MDTSLLEASSTAPNLAPFIVFVLLVATTIYFSHVLRGTVLTEAAVALIVGLAAGAGFWLYFELARGTSIPKHLVRFKYEVYFDILLPPIIFNAGYNMKKKAFFSNFTVLMVLGVAGTILSTAMLAKACSVVLKALNLDHNELIGNSLALGAVFSSTDSVAALQVLNPETSPQLYSLVFGEAVTNDATSVVLFRAVQHIRKVAQLNGGALGVMLLRFVWLFVGSLVLGVSIGLLCSYIIKRSFLGRQCAHEREVSLVALLGFLSYLVAEQLGLSGIFSAFFCGLSISHWSWHSLSDEAKISSLYGFRTLAFIAETLLFLSAGLDMWTTSLWRKELYTKGKMLGKTIKLALALTFLVPITRLFIVFPLIWMMNIANENAGNYNFYFWTKSMKRPNQESTSVTAGQTLSSKKKASSAHLGLGETAALWWAGCLRGAVTVALAVNHFAGSGKEAGVEASIQNQIICEACMAAVVLSTVVFGGVTGWILPQFLAFDQDKERRNTRDQSLEGYDDLQDSLLQTSLLRDNGDSGSSGAIPALVVHDRWVDFDRKYLQPIFGGRINGNNNSNNNVFSIGGDGESIYSSDRHVDIDARLWEAGNR